MAAGRRPSRAHEPARGRAPWAHTAPRVAVRTGPSASAPCRPPTLSSTRGRPRTPLGNHSPVQAVPGTRGRVQPPAVCHAGPTPRPVREPSRAGCTTGQAAGRCSSRLGRETRGASRLPAGAPAGVVPHLRAGPEAGRGSWGLWGARHGHHRARPTSVTRPPIPAHHLPHSSQHSRPPPFRKNYPQTPLAAAHKGT